jgi:predicted ATPase/DNA-binding SARP family transcriptional activator
MMARLSLSCLGPFQVTLDGQPVTRFKSNKVRALLAYLAVEADRPHRREVLAGLLWPDWPNRDALSNLRYALSNLRRVTGDRTADPPFLLIARDTLQFNAASDYWLDVKDFTDLTCLQDPSPSSPRSISGQAGQALSSLEKAVALYRGSFLEGFSLADSAPFEEWALLTRERLARQMSSTLHHLAATYAQRGQYEQAQSFARQQVEREPWNETAHQQLMRALALNGQRSAALAQYEACRRLLAEELGVEPAAETTGLYEQIRDGELKVPPSHLAPPPDLTPEPPPFLQAAEPAEVEEPVFVARERELAQLGQFLDLALAGQGRVVFVTGDVGSGKTALIQAFARRAQAAHPDLVVAGGQGNAHTGVGDPYLPFREILGLLSGDVEAQWAAGAMTSEQARRLWHLLPQAVEALVKTGPDLIDLLVPGALLLERARTVRPWPLGSVWLAQLETLVAHKAAAPSMPALQQSALFEEYTQVLRTLAAQKPLLLTVDDLQWADSGSVNLLFHLGRRLAGSRILLVGAYRPAETALGRPVSLPMGGTAERELDAARERHPLEPIVNELKRAFGDIEVDLERTEGRPFVDALLDSEPNRLASAFREALHLRTQGHPLFTVELLRGMQERGDLVQDGEGRWVQGPTLDWETLPARVEAVIAERIGRLPHSLRQLLSVASVEGETFTTEVVARLQVASERETVRCLSETLDRQHRVVSARGIRRLGSQRLSRYRFRHILFQKYLYGTLDQVERVYLHEQVGTALEELHGDEGIAAVALELARHFQEAEITEKAIRYLHQAGKRAVQLSAYEEGIAHLTRGLALLTALPHSRERDEQELALQLTLGAAQIGHGTFFREVGTAYARARELGQQTGKTEQLCQALGELAIFHYVRAEHHAARALAEEALSQARRTEDPLLVAWCHWHLGFILFGLGEYTLARDHLEQVIAFYVPEKHHRSFVLLPGADAGVSAMAYEACCLWCLGYPEQAAKHSQEALTLARELGHPLSLADVLCYAGCLFNAMRRDAQALKQHAEELMQSAIEQVPSWLEPGTSYRGQAVAMLGQVQEGMTQMREGIAAGQSRGVRCYVSGVLRSLAEAQAKADRPEEGLSTLAEALAFVEQTDERHWEAELYRLRAELLLMQGKAAEAEASLHQAIEVARRQRAKSWELRATTSLARLWQGQGRIDEARQTLAQVYGWFTEGFDTPDLREAKALLEELT